MDIREIVQFIYDDIRFLEKDWSEEELQSIISLELTSNGFEIKSNAHTKSLGIEAAIHPLWKKPVLWVRANKEGMEVLTMAQDQQKALKIYSEVVEALLLA